MEPKEYNFIEREYPAFIKVFETVRLKKQNNFEQIQILESKLTQLNKDHKIIVSSIVMQDIISYVENSQVWDNYLKRLLALWMKELYLLSL